MTQKKREYTVEEIVEAKEIIDRLCYVDKTISRIKHAGEGVRIRVGISIGGSQHATFGDVERVDGGRTLALSIAEGERDALICTLGEMGIRVKGVMNGVGDEAE